jgi:hypothetical protein
MKNKSPEYIMALWKKFRHEFAVCNDPQIHCRNGCRDVARGQTVQSPAYTTLLKEYQCTSQQPSYKDQRESYKFCMAPGVGGGIMGIKNPGSWGADDDQKYCNKNLGGAWCKKQYRPPKH